MIEAIKAFLAPYRIWLIIGAAALALLAGWRAHKLVIDAESADRLRSALNNRIAAEEFGFQQGMNLETNLNDYRADARDLDLEVYDATVSDAGNRFNADSVRRTAGRIAAGKAIRQRAH